MPPTPSAWNPISVASSVVKTRFGEFQERAAHGECFRISRNGRKNTVLLSWEAFEALTGAAGPGVDGVCTAAAPALDAAGLRSIFTPRA